MFKINSSRYAIVLTFWSNTTEQKPQLSHSQATVKAIAKATAKPQQKPQQSRRLRPRLKSKYNPIVSANVLLELYLLWSKSIYCVISLFSK